MSSSEEALFKICWDWGRGGGVWGDGVGSAPPPDPPSSHLTGHVWVSEEGTVNTDFCTKKQKKLQHPEIANL